jgi:hypothetical protein
MHVHGFHVVNLLDRSQEGIVFSDGGASGRAAASTAVEAAVVG